MSQVTREQFVKALTAYGTDRAVAEYHADVRYGPQPRHTMRPLSDPVITPRSAINVGVREAAQLDIGISAPIRASRSGDAVWMEIQTPPRTKKNSAETLGSQKSPMYKKYLRELLDAIACVHEPLLLPLPDRRPIGYNLKAHFYVDAWGERADRVGLEQGLYDALQAAKVVGDDWVFRQGDGTRVIAGSRPRVELWISPLNQLVLTPGETAR